MSLTQTIPLTTSPGTPPQYHYRSDVVPRLQWGCNWGYCGETSFICAGLRFGQYCSQWTVRELASPGIPQYQPYSQLLLGSGNDLVAARKMRLQASEFYGVAHAGSDELIVWAKNHLFAHHVPIIGVFINGVYLENWPPDCPDCPDSPDCGDQQYDHIVPILGYYTDHPYATADGSYHPGDWIALSDNGLYGEPGDYPFVFSYEVGSFQGSREQANAPDGLMYTLLRREDGLLRTRPEQRFNYGVAIEGVLDLDGVCIPVRLSCDENSEPPPASIPTPAGFSADDGPYADQRPTFVTDIVLNAEVYLPDLPPGQQVDYNLYLYDDFEKVPVANFNAAHTNAIRVWHIPAGSPSPFTVTHPTTSDQTRVFRAVPASAP